MVDRGVQQPRREKMANVGGVGQSDEFSLGKSHLEEGSI